MKGLLEVLKRRLILILRSPLGATVFFIGLLSLYYVLQPTLHSVHEEVRTFIVDRPEGEEHFIEDEDYLLEKLHRRKEPAAAAAVLQNGDEVVSSSSGRDEEDKAIRIKGKSVDQLFWQEVTEANDDLYVYSAYYDVNFRSIRVIAVANKHKSQNLECRFGNEAAAVIGNSEAEIKIIRETREFTFSAAFILCALPSDIVKGDAELPKFVSVASTRLSYVSPTANILEIQYPVANPSTKFSVCVQPTFNFDNAVRFVEWIEFHRSLGVERFTFYNISIGPGVSCIIEEYNKLFNDPYDETDIYIEILPWGDPSSKIISQVTIKEQNQLAALNDCIYRHRGISQYVFNIDLDEFIIPHKDSNYEDLIKRLDLLSGRRQIGLYEFRNAFFSPSYKIPHANSSNDDVSELNKSENEIEEAAELDTGASTDGSDIDVESLKSKVLSQLVTLEHTIRMAEPHPTDYRTKYICNPLKLVEGGIHHTWEMLQGFGTLNVPLQIGMLNHYRYNDNVTVVEDLAARNLSLKYEIGDKVISRVFSSFLETCRLTTALI